MRCSSLCRCRYQLVVPATSLCTNTNVCITMLFAFLSNIFVVIDIPAHLGLSALPKCGAPLCQKVCLIQNVHKASCTTPTPKNIQGILIICQHAPPHEVLYTLSEQRPSRAPGQHVLRSIADSGSVTEDTQLVSRLGDLSVDMFEVQQPCTQLAPSTYFEIVSPRKLTLHNSLVLTRGAALEQIIWNMCPVPLNLDVPSCKLPGS